MFLMPSRFEPCGLNQLYSLRYGTLPIVRATGGLTDTVEDAGVKGKGTGFTFSQYTPGAMVDAVRRALTAFRKQNSGAPCSVGRWSRTIPGTLRPESMSKCTER